MKKLKPPQKKQERKAVERAKNLSLMELIGFEHFGKTNLKTAKGKIWILQKIQETETDIINTGRKLKSELLTVNMCLNTLLPTVF